MCYIKTTSQAICVIFPAQIQDMLTFPGLFQAMSTFPK